MKTYYRFDLDRSVNAEGWEEIEFPDATVATMFRLKFNV
jgi:hypothetical protein